MFTLFELIILQSLSKFDQLNRLEDMHDLLQLPCPTWTSCLKLYKT